MKGSVTFDHIPTGNLRGADKTQKIAELKKFANLLGASCPSGQSHFYFMYIYLRKFFKVLTFQPRMTDLNSKSAWENVV